MFTTDNLVFCNVKHRRYRCHIIFCSLCICKRTVGDTTTTMGFSIFIFDQKPCSACGEIFLAFLVLKSIGAATINPCRWHSNWICQRQFPEIYLTFTRKPQHRCSCSFTRIWRFFQIHSVQWSSLIVGIYLKKWTQRYL